MGGSQTQQSQWPSLGLLYNKRKNTQCTGSLLTPTWVAASYSCMYPDVSSDDWVLYSGSTMFTIGGNTSVEVKNIVPHPQVSFIIKK